MSASPVPPESTRATKALQTSKRSLCQVPKTATQWETVAKKLGYERASLSLHELDHIHSASKLTHLDFIAMRALWPSPKGRTKFPGFDDSITTKVSNALQNFPEWTAYLNRFEDPDDTGEACRELGCFLIVKESQQKVKVKPPNWSAGLESDSIDMGQSRVSTRERREIPPPNPVSVASGSDNQSPGPSRTTPSVSDWSTSSSCSIQLVTKDEQIVNDALLLFLRALLIYLPEARNARCQWEVDRSPFDKAVFGDNHMTARTDGCLRAKNGHVFAIAEVKPNARSLTRRPELLWQETGEMIAWVMHDISHKRERPPPRRLLVSQDNHAIYLTLASLDTSYTEYLQRGLIKTDPSLPEDPRPALPFLKMQQYGPWKINEKAHMEDLAKIIIGVAFEVAHDLTLSETSQET